MNTKRLLAIGLVGAIAVSSALSVSAADLTKDNPTGQTEVTGQILGNDPDGNVSYIIRIPDLVDFGVLTQPKVNEDSFKDVPYTVEAIEITGLETDEQVSVYVRDQNASVDGSHQFFITNKADADKQLEYDVYTHSLENDQVYTDNINRPAMTSAIGYYLNGFTQVGEAVNGMLRLNQAQLYGVNINDYVGDYSGYMVFHSAVETQP